MTIAHAHRLPLPTPLLPQLLIFGALLRCVDPILSIAAVLSSRSPFLNLQSREPEERQAIEAARKKLIARCALARSDHLLFAEAFAKYRSAKDKRGFCFEHGLSIDGMANLRQTRGEYARELSSIGFLRGGSLGAAEAAEANVNSDSPRMVSAALCAALYNNVLHVVRPTQKYHETAEGAVEAAGKARDLQVSRACLLCGVRACFACVPVARCSPAPPLLLLLLLLLCEVLPVAGQGASEHAVRELVRPHVLARRAGEHPPRQLQL